MNNLLGAGMVSRVKRAAQADAEASATPVGDLAAMAQAANAAMFPEGRAVAIRAGAAGPQESPGLIVRREQAHSRRCRARDGSQLHFAAQDSLWLTEQGYRPRGGKLGPYLWFVVTCSGGSGEPGRCCRFWALVRRDSIEQAVRAALRKGGR